MNKISNQQKTLHKKSLLEIEDVELADCICRECEKVYQKRFDVSYILSSDTPRYNGYIVVVCNKCKIAIKRKLKKSGIKREVI